MLSVEFTQLQNMNIDEFAELDLTQELNEEEATPTDSQPENEENEEAKPSQEGDNTPDVNNQPLHQNPRFKEVIDEKNYYKEKVDSLESKINEFEEFKKSQEQNTPVVKPDWFVSKYGDDDDLWSNYSSQRQQDKDEIKDSILNEIKQSEQQEAEQQRKNQEWINTELDKISVEHDVDLSNSKGNNSLRNEFVQFLVDMKPTDENGDINVSKGWEYFSKTINNDYSKSQARRKIADNTSSESSSQTVQEENVVTWDVSKRRGF